MYVYLSFLTFLFRKIQIESHGVCRSDNAVAFLTPLACINFVVVLIACWQAFKGRNVSSEFAESKYIGLSVASLFQAFLTGLPIVVIVKDEPKAFYLVLVLMIFVLSEVILLLIFLPKIFLAYQYSGMSEADQKKVMRDRIEGSAKSSTGNRSSWLQPTAPAFYGEGVSAIREERLPESKSTNSSRVTGENSSADIVTAGENSSADIITTDKNDLSNGEKEDNEENAEKS